MWWNGRFASWMCSRQICSNWVMLSRQYGPKSLRNVSNTLLKLCHEELRQFWRQNGVQPSTSKVYLIKWPVNVYIYIYIYIYMVRIWFFVALKCLHWFSFTCDQASMCIRYRIACVNLFSNAETAAFSSKYWNLSMVTVWGVTVNHSDCSALALGSGHHTP